MLILWFVPRSVSVRNPVVLILLALPMVFGQVKRNWFYGVRTGYSMSSDEVWYRQTVIRGGTCSVADMPALRSIRVLPRA